MGGKAEWLVGLGGEIYLPLLLLGNYPRGGGQREGDPSLWLRDVRRLEAVGSGEDEVARGSGEGA